MKIMSYDEAERERKRQIETNLSLVLRYRPENIGLNLDRHGWARVDELLDKFEKECGLDFLQLEEIVETDKFNEYSFNEDKTLIRANFGHTIPVLFEHEEDSPPKTLYYGTNKECMQRIAAEGLIKQDGVYVYLFNNMVAARFMGRRYGEPVVYRVDSRKMSEDGFKFYYAANYSWLADEVPAEYIEWMSDY